MNEKLSALMDGELDRDDAHRAIKALGADTAQRECWDAYHLIGACLRGDAIESGGRIVTARSASTGAIFARLAEEPTVLAPAAIRRLPMVEGRTRMVLAMAASVVTVSAIGVVALKQQQGAAVAPVNLVQQVAPAPVADNSVQRAQAELRVNDYLVVHRQFANPNAFQAANLSRSRESAEGSKRAAGR
jgi:sigma-E factor negative regulatory protein RseA